MYIELLNENGIKVIDQPKFMKNIDRSMRYMEKVPVYDETDANKKEFRCFMNISKKKCIVFKDDSMKKKIVVKKKVIIIYKWIDRKWNEITIPIKMVKG